MPKRRSLSLVLLEKIIEREQGYIGINQILAKVEMDADDLMSALNVLRQVEKKIVQIRLKDRTIKFCHVVHLPTWIRPLFDKMITLK